MLVMFKS